MHVFSDLIQTLEEFSKDFYKTFNNTIRQLPLCIAVEFSSLFFAISSSYLIVVFISWTGFQTTIYRPNQLCKNVFSRLTIIKIWNSKWYEVIVLFWIEYIRKCNEKMKTRRVFIAKMTHNSKSNTKHSWYFRIFISHIHPKILDYSQKYRYFFKKNSENVCLTQSSSSYFFLQHCHCHQYIIHHEQTISSSKCT